MSLGVRLLLSACISASAFSGDDDDTDTCGALQVKLDPLVKVVKSETIFESYDHSFNQSLRDLSGVADPLKSDAIVVSSVFILLSGVIMAGIAWTRELSDEIVECEAPARLASAPDFSQKQAEEQEEEEEGATSDRGCRQERATTVAHIEQLVETDRWVEHESYGSMTRFNMVVNMIADNCPLGSMPLAYGMRYTTLLAAYAVLFVMYSLCVYTMWAISRSCYISGERNFASVWERAIGRETSWIPLVVVALVCASCNISYMCMYASLFESTLPALGFKESIFSYRVCMVILTAIPTLPLCMLKDMRSLRFSSAFAALAVAYTAIVMTVRALDGTYHEGGYFHGPVAGEEKQVDPFVEKVAGRGLHGVGPTTIVFANYLSIGVMSHYNGCKYFRELEGRPQGKVQVFRRSIAVAMAFVILLFAIIMTAGNITFGESAEAVILQSYSKADWLVNAAKISMGLSVVASFPLVFSGARECAIQLLKRAFSSQSDFFDLLKVQDLISVGLVLSMLFVALLIRDSTFFVSMVGAVAGNAIIMVIPCALYCGCIKKFLSEGRNKGELYLNILLGLFGVAFACIGVYCSVDERLWHQVKTIEFHRSPAT